jgi:hypothetical protein
MQDSEDTTGFIAAMKALPSIQTVGRSHFVLEEKVFKPAKVIRDQANAWFHQLVGFDDPEFRNKKVTPDWSELLEDPQRVKALRGRALNKGLVDWAMAIIQVVGKEYRSIQTAYLESRRAERPHPNRAEASRSKKVAAPKKPPKLRVLK